MGTATKWAARIGLGLVLTAGLGAAGVFAASEAVRHKHYAKAPVSLQASQDPGAAARGARLATIYGCHDCHGADLTGRLFHDDLPIGRITGANLTLAVAHQSDADLARAIRTGVAADGRGLWVMPSAAFSQLTDAETADLVAYLRTFAPKGGQSAGLRPGPLARLGMALGQFHSEPDMLAAGITPAFDAGAQTADGRALTRACAECHGTDLKGGGPPLNAPDLTIAASYTPEEFSRLMHTGVASGERRLPMMTPTAQTRFKTLSDNEVAALHGYLRERAAKMN